MLQERNKIIEAALDEFVEVGFSDSSLESIAKGAELETGVVRALFVDKENLLRELFKEKTEPMVSAISLAVQEIENPKELIRKSMGYLDSWLMMHPKVVRLYMRSLLEQSDVLESTFEQYLMPSEIFERFGQMIERGEVRCKNIKILSLLLDSLILFFHVMNPGMQMIDPDLSMEECAGMRFDAIIDLLEHGLYTD